MNPMSLTLLQIGLGLVALVVLIAWRQGKSFQDVTGFDRRDAWSYRDTALSAIACISGAWAVVGLGLGSNSFDRKVGAISLVISIVSCAVSPNRMALFPVPMAFVAFQGWWTVLFTNDPRSWWIAIPATILTLVYLRLFGHYPTRARTP